MNEIDILINKHKKTEIKKENKYPHVFDNIPLVTPRVSNYFVNTTNYPQIQNVVSTMDLGIALDLNRIALVAKNTEYNPKRFGAIIMRIREPVTTALVFGSGKVVCTGAKSEEESRIASRKFARAIQRIGYQTKFQSFTIQNIVSSCHVGFKIRLEFLQAKHHIFASYEPEIFPGLIYRMINPKIVILIFTSGNIVITGAKITSDIKIAFENIYPILQDSKMLEPKKEV